VSRPPDLKLCFSFLVGNEDATWFDLIDRGLMDEGSLLEPEHVLASAVDATRSDLVDEFRKAPLGPYSGDLQLLAWRLRAQTPNGRRYVLRQSARGWQIACLSGGRRPRSELVGDDEYETREECEWAIFALRWRDHTGQALPLRRDT
jgi:hypothetical protein